MVSTLLAKLVTQGKDKLKSVYDPTCGSGSLLLKVSKEIKRKGGEVGGYFGQESNPSTYNLARMNMILHGVHYRNFDIQQDDTLEQPHHVEKRFEAVVANPPFSAKWSAAAGFLTDERFQDYGKLAPASKADFAFVQHMVHQLDESGVMAVVLPHGALFRSAGEGHIRKHLIENKNFLDAVIGLPANLFYGTNIPTCILILKKNRKNTDNILFIDSKAYSGKSKNQDYLRGEDIERILEAYNERQFIDKYAYVASIDEIKEDHNYNLSIPRYVDTYIEEEPIDLNLVVKEYVGIGEQLNELDAAIIENCNDLGISPPIFGEEK